MKNKIKRNSKLSSGGLFFLSVIVLATMLPLGACKDDPKPPNEEEVVTTLTVVLTRTGGSPVTLKFYDADGDGSIAPVKTVSGSLVANASYTGTITLLNEAENPDVDITAEILEEANDHL